MVEIAIKCRQKTSIPSHHTATMGFFLESFEEGRVTSSRDLTVFQGFFRNKLACWKW